MPTYVLMTKLAPDAIDDADGRRNRGRGDRGGSGVGFGDVRERKLLKPFVSRFKHKRRIRNIEIRQTSDDAGKIVTRDTRRLIERSVI